MKVALNMQGDSSTPSYQSEIDLWVCGAGTLGQLVCEQYKKHYPSATVVGETNTAKRHDYLSSIGVLARERGTRSEKDFQSAKNLVICIPPTGIDNYANEIRETIKVWKGPSHGGKLVFTSSVGVYGETNGLTVDEETSVDRNSPRAVM